MNRADFENVLTYHGAKNELAPWIISHFPRHEIYVEPFGGSAAVLLQKERSALEVYNDLDDEVVNLFRVIRDEQSRDALCELLAFTPYAEREYEEAFAETSDDIERARRLVVRSRMGYGSRGPHVKTGFKRSGTTLSRNVAQFFARLPERVEKCAARFVGVEIECSPAVEVCERRDSKETLVYADPPYVETARNYFGAYKHEMTEREHVELATCLHALEAYVVISGYESDLYASLYADWEKKTRKTTGDSRVERVEVLWLNPRCARALEVPAGPLFA